MADRPRHGGALTRRLRESVLALPHWLRYAKYRSDLYARYWTALGPVDALRVLLAMTRLDAEPNRTVSVRVRKLGIDICLRPGAADRSAFEKVFVWQEYAVPIDPAPTTIIDCGGNVGLSALWFTLKYPFARIVVLEPDPWNFAILRANVKAFPNIRPIQGGIWSRPCVLRPIDPSAAADALAFVEAPAGTADGVPAFDLAEVMRQHGFGAIDLLKMDIEGAEAEVFSHHVEGWLAKTRTVIVEMHGERARRSVEAALPATSWRQSRCGENDVFVRASNPTAPRVHGRA